jgi:hypothetical protein
MGCICMVYLETVCIMEDVWVYRTVFVFSNASLHDLEFEIYCRTGRDSLVYLGLINRWNIELKSG